MIRRAVAAIVVLTVAVFAHGAPAARTLGFDTAMLYRYPWDHGVTMTRTQGWDGDVSHDGDLFYAVDWDNGTGHWLARAANGGSIQCNDILDIYQPTFGNYIGVHNSVANQMSVYAHLQNCAFFTPGIWYHSGTQGQALAPVSDTGQADGVHLHFHVINGNNLTGLHTTVPFEMSDQNAFSGEGSNGPSDNAPVAEDNLGNPQPAIRTAYLAAGGASGSWWNIGSPWATGGGPCIFSQNPFVHSCGTDFGTLTLQNYIQIITNEPSALARNSSGSTAYRIRGATWRALGTSFRINDILTALLGRPTGAESTSGVRRIQNFQGGRIERYTDRVRQDAFLNGVWRSTYYFQTSVAGECPDVNADFIVDLSDSLDVLAHFGETDGAGPFDPRYDLDRTGGTDFADYFVTAAVFGVACQV